MLTEIPFDLLPSTPEWTLEGSSCGETPKLSCKNKANKLIADFNEEFGTDAGNLPNWQALCRDVDLKGDLPSITKCKKALAKIDVNLVDLVAARKAGKAVKRFGSAAALKKYTRRTNKFFPRKEAKVEGFHLVVL